MHYQQNINDDVVLMVPLTSYQRPKSATWFKPEGNKFQLDMSSTFIPRDKPYQFWINSDIHSMNESSFGYYNLSVEAKEIVSILLEDKSKTMLT